MKLTDLFPTANLLLELEPEELAGFVLEYFHSKGDPEKFSEHPANFSGESTLWEYERSKCEECQKVVDYRKPGRSKNEG